MAVGAWQDMFKVVNLEDRPAGEHHSQQVLYNDGINEIVIKTVLVVFTLLTVDSSVLR
jgi:hypothetical protein